MTPSTSAAARAASATAQGPVRLDAGKRVLVVGASGSIGAAVVRLLAQQAAVIGAHYHEHREPLQRLAKQQRLDEARLQLYAAELSSQPRCHVLVDQFVKWAGGIDGLVQLSGNIRLPRPWQDVTEGEWAADLAVNLSGPFFLAQRAMHYMKTQPDGGRIILTSTASAQHGGGSTSMAYGVAKAGIECLAKGLARDGAPHGILVNVVAPGFIDSPFHTERMRRSREQLVQRAALVPLKRAGTPDEVARVILFLLSVGGDYITGQCLAVSGGDWL